LYASFNFWIETCLESNGEPMNAWPHEHVSSACVHVPILLLQFPCPQSLLLIFSQPLF
jgi:hypothetical protein